MGLGPLNDFGHQFWREAASYPQIAVDFIVSVADRALPYAPLITSCVAITAGCIAYYSICVTRGIARKRATIDFFLKTEMDSSIVKLFQDFDDHARKVIQNISEGEALSRDHTDHRVQHGSLLLEYP